MTTSFFTRPAVLAMVGGAVFLTAYPVQGLITVGKGNDPVHDPGWPVGCLAVANLGSRVAWMEGPPFGGGQWTFFYRGGTDQLAETLRVFSAIAAPRLEVILHAGRGTHHVLDGEGYDWSFEVWVQQNWERLFNRPTSFYGLDHPDVGQALPAPRLDVWLCPEGPDWPRVTVPANLVVEDQRATSHGHPPGSGSVIRLTVTDYQGRPIPDARLEVAAVGQKTAIIREAKADANGAAVATNVAAGTYRLAAAAPGYAPRLLEYGRYGTNDYRRFSTKLAPAATLVGRVEEGRPLANARVQPAGLQGPDGLGYPMPEMPQAISDDAGRFRLSGLPVGKLQLRASLADYHYLWDPKEVFEARLDGQPTGSPCILKMVPTGTVRVQVVIGDGQPLIAANPGEVHVHIQEADRSGVGSWGGSGAVGTNGVCEFKSVPPGRYRLSTRPLLDRATGPGVDEVILEVQPRRVNEAALLHRGKSG